MSSTTLRAEIERLKSDGRLEPRSPRRSVSVWVRTPRRTAASATEDLLGHRFWWITTHYSVADVVTAISTAAAAPPL